MTLKTISLAAALAAMAVSPATAQPSLPTNPAASLSVAHADRAGSSKAHGSRLAGLSPGLIALIVVAAVGAGAIGYAVSDANSSRSP